MVTVKLCLVVPASCRNLGKGLLLSVFSRCLKTIQTLYLQYKKKFRSLLFISPTSAQQFGDILETSEVSFFLKLFSRKNRETESLAWLLTKLSLSYVNVYRINHRYNRDPALGGASETKSDELKQPKFWFKPHRKNKSVLISRRYFKSQ